MKTIFIFRVTNYLGFEEFVGISAQSYDRALYILHTSAEVDPVKEYNYIGCKCYDRFCDEFNEAIEKARMIA